MTSRHGARPRDSCKTAKPGLPGPSEENSPAVSGHKEAWLRLQNHHGYLVWTAASHCAAHGHDLAYAFGVAKALTGACFSFNPGKETTFDDNAKSYIASSLEKLLGCPSPGGLE